MKNRYVPAHRNKYLDKIGIPRDHQGTRFTKDRKKFRKQRKKFGFDQREIYNLDHTFAEWLYCRLKMYNELNCVDTSYHKIEWEGKTITMQDAIDILLKASRHYLKGFAENSGGLNTDELDKRFQKLCDLMPLWGKLLPYLWW